MESQAYAATASIMHIQTTCTQIHTHTNTYTHNHIHTLTHMHIYCWGHTGLMSAPSSECLSVVVKGWVND